MPAPRSLLLLTAAAALAAGCAPAAAYTWVEAYPLEAAAAPGGASIIAEGDLLSVRVYGQEGMSGDVRVREDGMISLPFVGEQRAARLTPDALADRLRAAYATYVVGPVVQVSLEASRPAQVSVLGAVVAPGRYPLAPGSGLLQAVALAGGLTPFADRERLFVVRAATDGRGHRRGVRLRFTWSALVGGRGPAAAFDLRDGDVLVVED